MKIDKNKFICFLIFFMYAIWSFCFFGSSTVHENIVTAYDEIRYLNATDQLIIDLKEYGFLYTLENYYNYSQSVHFLHYFILAFMRYIFNDSMFFWTLYQVGVYCIGAFYFSKYMELEYKFIEKTQLKFISLLVLIYPVYYYLTFSLMRDIAIFSFLSMSLYFYKKNSFIKLFLVLMVLSFYRINMTLCILVYIIFDQFKGKNFLLILRYLLISFVAIYIIDLVSFGFISRNVGRLSDLSILNFINEFLVFMFSPLPFTIDSALPEYLRLWLKVSFFICMVLIVFHIIFLIYRRFEVIVPAVPIIFMSLFYVFIYSTEAGIGFRQSSIMLPFIYIPILFFIMDSLRRRYS